MTCRIYVSYIPRRTRDKNLRKFNLIDCRHIAPYPFVVSKLPFVSTSVTYPDGPQITERGPIFNVSVPEPPPVRRCPVESTSATSPEKPSRYSFGNCSWLTFILPQSVCRLTPRAVCGSRGTLQYNPHSRIVVRSEERRV